MNVHLVFSYQFKAWFTQSKCNFMGCLAKYLVIGAVAIPAASSSSQVQQNFKTHSELDQLLVCAIGHDLDLFGIASLLKVLPSK